MSDFYNKYPYTDFHELNLDWVIERVKKLTEDWAATLEEWNNTEEQWQELYDYVHDYFDNLDVQQEINNKINTMIADGTFVTVTTPVIEAKVASMMPSTVASQIDAVVASQIDGSVASQIDGSVSSQLSTVASPIITEWMNDNITQPTTPVVDASLSVSGAAADAAVTGEVRTTGIEADKINVAGLFASNGYTAYIRNLTINTNELYSNTGSGTHVLIPIMPGDAIRIKANSTYKTYYAILTQIDVPVVGETPSLSTAAGYTECIELGVNATATFTAPNDAAYLYLTDTISGNSFLPVIVEVNEINMLTGVITKIQENRSILDTKVTMQPGNNLYNPNASGIVEGKYIRSNGAETSNASYSISDYIPVTPGTTYYFSSCVAAGSTTASAFYTANKTLISTGSMVSETAPVNAAYLRVSVVKALRYNQAQVRTADNVSYEPFTYTNYPTFDLIAENYDSSVPYIKGQIISKNGIFYKAKMNTTAESFDPDHWTVCRDLITSLDAVKFSQNSISQSGSNIAANTNVTMPGVTNIAKNVIYQFCATFGTFTGLTVGQGLQTTKYSSWIELDTTTLKVRRSAGGGTYAESTYNHGLSISAFLNIQILTDDNYHCIVRLQTDGAEYVTPTSASFTGNCVGQYYFESETVIDDYTYTVIFKDAVKPIYLFGDSYMSFVPERWVYHLKEISAFDNILINACSGESSTGAVQALNTLQGEPKFALWALGMNDSSDVDSSTPASNWLSGFNAFVNWCNAHHCTPILGTIPTVPNGGVLINNEGKNTYIRNSGYRYIDFAKAVCPAGDGIWYTGMIQDDGVHPTEKGAIALFNRALADFPEIAGSL